MSIIIITPKWERLEKIPAGVAGQATPVRQY
jgi:hypothetical protein